MNEKSIVAHLKRMLKIQERSIRLRQVRSDEPEFDFKRCCSFCGESIPADVKLKNNKLQLHGRVIVISVTALNMRDRLLCAMHTTNPWCSAMLRQDYARWRI